MRTLLQRLLVLAIAGAFGLALGEVAVRVLTPQPRLVIEPGGFYSLDPPGRYRLTPGYRGRITNRAEYDNEIRINRAGLRGPEPLPEAADRLRVLAVGDSFTFGVGVEDGETFVARLAEKLAARGVPAEGLNAGTPAFGVPDAETWFRLHGAELKPDVLVLAIFLGNDLIDASPDREEILVVNGLLVPSQSPRGLKAWLFRSSHLYVALKGLLETPALSPVRSRLGLGEPWTTRVLREELEVYRKGAVDRLAPAVTATDRALERLAAHAAQTETQLVAMLIPSEIQVDSERWATAVESLRLDPSAYDPLIPARIFRRLLEKHAIASVEPDRALAAGIARGEAFYFRRDRHWTNAGHELAAEVLAGFVLDRLSQR